MRRALLAVSLFAAGCAGDASLPPLADDHPANPAAPTAPLERATTLTSATAPATAPRTPATKPAAGGRYVCPMHDQVTSDDPNARCPICSMRLVPKKGAAR
jgi:hypothetical protein